jgi:transposase-like protein
MAELDEATLRRWYLDEGRSIGTIARTLGVRKQIVCDALAMWDIPCRPRGWQITAPVRDERLNEIYLRQRYLEDSANLRDIAAETGVSHSTVRRALIQWNITRQRRGPRRDRPAPPEAVRLAIRSRVAVLGIQETARRIQQPIEVIHAILGTEPLPRGATPRVDDQMIRSAYDDGLPIKEIAAQAGVSRRSIERSLQRTCIRPASPTTKALGTKDETMRN